MRALFLFLLLYLSCVGTSFAQNKDSIKMANAFTNALTSPDKKEVYLKEALGVKQLRKSRSINEMYAYLNARYLFFSGQFDAAESAVLKQLKVDPKSEGKAKFYNILGARCAMQKDLKKAISWYEKAIENFEAKGDKKGSALVKSNVANIFFSLSDFESAYKYMNEAHKDLIQFNDSTNLPVILGILSISEAETGRFKMALKHANETLEKAQRYNNPKGIALAHLAHAEIALSEERHLDAIVYYKQTDSVATLIKSANLVHLAHVGMLTNYISLKDFKKAKQIGEKALGELVSVPNKTTEYVIRKKLAKAYAGLNEYQKAYTFKRQADSIYTETSSLKNKEYINELLIRHDTERKENQLKIERKENVLNEAQLTKQGWILFALALVLLIAILIFIGYRNVQRNKMKYVRAEQEKELMRALIDGEENERERVANELHDGLASDLTGIKMILSQSEVTLPEGVLSALTRVHEETRRISHNMSPLNLEKLGLVSALSNFSQENATTTTHIQFYSSKEYIDIQPIEHAVLIYRITQEFIQNALKHADCSKIDVQLMVHEHELTINIEDNGCGFDFASETSSFGLMNVKKNVDLLKGEMDIDSRPQKGTVVFISLPLT